MNNPKKLKNSTLLKELERRMKLREIRLISDGSIENNTQGLTS
jgi:hypothetical protein